MTQARLRPVVRHLRHLAGATPLHQRTDAELLQRFLADREEAAFGALVERHGRLVLGVCRQVLRHEQDAEDAFQATFLVLARQAASIRRTEAVGSWLYRVAHRIATKAGTAMARRRIHERRTDPIAAREPSAEASWREVQAVLREEVDHLPEKYRAPFVLCCLEGRSGAEAARHLGWKEGTVTGRLTIARRRLQGQLARRGITLAAVLAGLALVREANATPPRMLVNHTVQAAVQVAECGLAAGVASENVLTLAKNAALSSTVGKVRLATVLLFAAGVLAAGAEALTQPEAPAQPPPPAGEQAARTATSPAPAPVLEEKGETVAINGRVVDPDGKTVAGAEVSIGWFYGYALPWFPPVVKAFRPNEGATSGPDGRFRLSFTKAESFQAMDNGFQQPWRKTQIVVAAKGYGPGAAWLEHAKDGLTLRLARDDVPVHGRVLDLQGHPVAGAHVRMAYLTFGKDYLSLGSWAGLPADVTSDQDGRFVLTGIGRDRVAHLHVEGPTIEHKIVAVSTAATVGGKKRAHADVDVVVGPTKPIVGTIRARDTGKPLAGVTVSGNRETYRDGVQAVTDRDGRYRLVGLPKAKSYELTVSPGPGQHYLGRVWTVADSEGLKPVTADFGLRRGVPVRVRIVDRATGKPIRGVLLYGPLHDNPLYPESEGQGGFFPTPTFREWHFPKDHSFDLVVYPGPGVLFAWVPAAGTKYQRARLDPADKQRGYEPYKGKDPTTMGFLTLCEGYRIINLDQTDKTQAFDIAVCPEPAPEPGKDKK
jgi:RNA polymerase sigma factor (sigma-70 family)